MYKEDLPPSVGLKQNGLPDLVFVDDHQFGMHRLTIGRGCRYHTQIPGAQQRKLHRTGNRGGRKGQGIHRDLHGFEFFFGGDPKLLFFVNDQESQVFELDFGTNDFVGANQNINTTGFQILQNPFDFGRCSKTIQVINPYGQSLEPRSKGPRMLQGKDGGWDQDGGLFPVAGRLKGRPYSHLGFAKPHVTADQSIHGEGFLHVRFDRFGGFALIGGVFVQKRGFQLVLQVIIRGKGMPLGGFSPGVQLDQVFGDVLDLGLGFGFEFIPGIGSQFMNFGWGSVLAGIARNLVQGMNANIKQIVIPVTNSYRFLPLTVDLYFLHAGVFADPVIHVYNVVSRFEIENFFEG